MVGSSSEVYVSRFDDIGMKNVQDNTGSYNVAVQAIELSKKITFRELCMYP